MKSKFLKSGLQSLAAMLLLAGCNNAEMSFSNDVPAEEKGNLSFVLPLGGKSSITYATIGTDEEYELQNLFIYWFKNAAGTYKLAKTFKYGVGADDIELSNNTSSTQNTTTATINVGEDNTPSRFYIVANVNLGNGKYVNYTTGELSPNTTSTQFEQITGSIETGRTGVNDLQIATPLPMSISKTTGSNPGGYVDVPNPSTQGTINNVHLKRRVARFDIINTAAYSGIEILRVAISNPATRGWIHDTPFAYLTDLFLPDDTFVSWDVQSKANGGNLPLLGQDASKLDGTAGSDGIDDYFNTHKPDTAIQNKAVFYLLPTQLKPNYTGTQIILEGRSHGITKMYPLSLPDPTNGLPVEANKLYKIKVNRITESGALAFNITVDHWTEAETINAGKTGLSVTWPRSITPTHTNTVVSATCTPADIPENDFNNGTRIQYRSNSLDTIVLNIDVSGYHLNPSGHVVEAMISAKNSVTYDMDLAATSNRHDDLEATINRANITYETRLSYQGGTSPVYTTIARIKLPPTGSMLETVLHVVNPNDETEFIEFNLESLGAQ